MHKKIFRSLENSLHCLHVANFCCKHFPDIHYRTNLLYCIVICLVLIPASYAENIPNIQLPIIRQIESSNNPSAVNKSAIGLYQITPIARKDYNQINKTSITREELFIPEVNEKIAAWLLTKRIPQILRHLKKPTTKENILIGFNCGSGCVGKPLPSETKSYLRKYEKLERALCIKENGSKFSRLD